MARQRRGRGRESRRERRQRLLGSRSSRETPIVNIPELPDPVEVARNLPSSVGRSVSGLYNLLQPPNVGGNIVDWVTGEDKTEWFTEEQRAMGRVVSDFARLWSEDRQIYQDRSEFQARYPHAAAAGVCCAPYVATHCSCPPALPSQPTTLCNPLQQMAPTYLPVYLRINVTA